MSNYTINATGKTPEAALEDYSTKLAKANDVLKEKKIKQFNKIYDITYIVECDCHPPKGSDLPTEGKGKSSIGFPEAEEDAAKSLKVNFDITAYAIKADYKMTKKQEAAFKQTPKKRGTAFEDLGSRVRAYDIDF